MVRRGWWVDGWMVITGVGVERYRRIKDLDSSRSE